MSSGYIDLPLAGVPTYPNLASFPTAASVGNGALAIDLSTNILYESNGTSYLVVSNPAFASAITGLSGDVTATGPGFVPATIASGAVTNAKIAAAAGILVNKLAALTASTAVASDASGFLVSSATTSTELGYVSGVTSAIQTQLNAKQASGSYITALTGDVTASGPGSAASTIAALAVTNAKIANATIDLTTKVTGALPLANGGAGEDMTQTTNATTGTINALAVPTGFIRMTSATAVTINGITSDATAKRITIYAQAAAVTLVNQSASASAVDRLILTGSANYVISIGNSATLIYSTADSRWILTTFQKPPTGTTSQVIVTTSTTGISTLSLPQSIATTSSPSFTAIKNIGGVVVLDIGSSILNTLGNSSVDAGNRYLITSGGVPTVLWEDAAINDVSGNLSVDGNSRFLQNSFGATMMSWDTGDTETVSFPNAITTTGASLGTLTNAPTAGNPAIYLVLKVNGTLYKFPGWA